MPPLISTLASISVRGSSSIFSGPIIEPTILTPWVARIGKFITNSYSTISNIVVASNGDFYTCGTYKSYYGNPKTNFALTKFSSTGQIIWQKILGEFLTAEMSAMAVCVDSENNLYFVGYAVGYNNILSESTGQDGYFGKLNSADGSTVFIKRRYFDWYPIPDDRLNGIAYSPTDNTIVVTGIGGYTDGIPLGYYNKCLIAKYTLTGEVVWSRYNGYTTKTSDDGLVLYGNDVSIDSSGNIYVAATNNYYGGYYPTGNTLLSLTSDGTLRWVVREKFTGIDSNELYPRKIITTNNNNTVIAAVGRAKISSSSGTYIKMATVTQYDSSGIKLWQIQPKIVISGYTGTGPDFGSGVYICGLTSDSSNNIYLAARGISNFRISSSIPYGNDCILLYKIDGATGSVLWNRAIKLNASASAPGSGYNDNPATAPSGLKCLGNFLYIAGITNATLMDVRDTTNGVFLKIPTDGSLLSTNGFAINREMGFKIIDFTNSQHGLYSYKSTTQIVTNSINSDLGHNDYLVNKSVDVDLVSRDNNMARQLAVL
jgi:hypothetical protein